MPVIPAPSPADATKMQQAIEQQIKYQNAAKIAAQVYKANGCTTTWAEQTAKAAVDNHLPVRVVSGLVYVESSCRPTAVSSRGAVGLMQVNPHVWHFSRTELRNPARNLEIGSQILAGYVHRSGLRGGLHRFNGLGDDGTYAVRVLEAAYHR